MQGNGGAYLHWSVGPTKAIISRILTHVLHCQIVPMIELDFLPSRFRVLSQAKRLALTVGNVPLEKKILRPLEFDGCTSKWMDSLLLDSGSSVYFPHWTILGVIPPSLCHQCAFLTQALLQSIFWAVCLFIWIVLFCLLNTPYCSTTGDTCCQNECNCKAVFWQTESNCTLRCMSISCFDSLHYLFQLPIGDRKYDRFLCVLKVFFNRILRKCIHSCTNEMGALAI